MNVAESPTVIEENDQVLERILLSAELPPLLAALADLTGDASILAEELRAPMHRNYMNAEPQGGMTPAQQDRARALALTVMTRLRDEGVPAAGRLDAEGTRRALRFVAKDAGEDYLPLLLHELGGTQGADAETAAGGGQPAGQDNQYRVAIIGAGMSGLAAAFRLKEANIPFVLFEKNPDIGGTWFENTYPGCRLDTNNFTYSYSFAQNPDWPSHFSPQSAIFDYFRDFVTTAGLREQISFGTEVTSARFDDDSCEWDLVIAEGPDGTTRSLRVNAVISAVGQLNRPRFPDIPGQSEFRGRSWHTATWPEDAELKGLKVAVIGAGASGYQVVPSIVDTVDELIVFQRNAPWMLPTPAYHDDIDADLGWLFRHVPNYHKWYRFYQFWASVEGRFPYIVVDPDWTGEGSVSAANEQMRIGLTDHLHAQFADRPDLLEKVIPSYPPGAKRMLRDNGVWADALKRDHTQLVTDRIEAVTATGVRVAGGREYEVDVIIYATGFQAADFLQPMTVTGAGGIDLHDSWAGDARAYLGITIPKFPGLYCIYGPNTNLVVNGSIVLFSELAVQYAVDCVKHVIATGVGALDCRTEVFDTYNREIDEANGLRAWGASDVSSWYKNARGRVSQNWPYPILDYWQATSRVNFEDYRPVGRRNS